MHASIVLIALALGYQVLTAANKEKKELKILGQAIGAVIIISAAIGLVCISAASLKRGFCPAHQCNVAYMAQDMDSSVCPMMSKSNGATPADK